MLGDDVVEELLMWGEPVERLLLDVRFRCRCHLLDNVRRDCVGGVVCGGACGAFEDADGDAGVAGGVTRYQLDASRVDRSGV